MGTFSGKWISVALGAAVVSLACAIAAMFVARARLLEAGRWVRHTSDVELSIAACRVHVREAQLSEARLDLPGRRTVLAEAQSDVERFAELTADNPIQQTRAKGLLGQLRSFAGDSAEGLRIDQVLRDLGATESSLMDIRMATLKRTTRSGWLALTASATLTVLLVAVILTALRRQSLALALAEGNLRRKGALLESVVDSMADGIMAITPERTFLHVNRAARRLLGEAFPAGAFPVDWRAHTECIYEN